MNYEAQLLRLMKGLVRKLNREAGGVVSGRHTPASFYDHAREVIRAYHTKAAVIGARAASPNSPVPAGLSPSIALRAAASQDEFLKGFIRDIEAGRYKPGPLGGEGAVARHARFKLYAQRLVGTANQAFAEALESLSPAGEEFRWVLGIAEHCTDCIFESEQGWRTLFEMTRFPGDGSTACIVNCKCTLVSRGQRVGFRVRWDLDDPEPSPGTPQ